MAFPAVGRGEGRFITAVVEAAQGADQLPEEVPPGVRQALDAAREAGWFFHLSFLPAEASWEGASCGLAVALAARSLVRHQGICTLHSATGRVDLQGRVLSVGKVPDKLRLRHEARPWGRMLIPHDDRGGELPVFVQSVADLDQAWAALGHSPDRDPEDQVRRVKDLDRKDPQEAARLALPLLDDPDLSDGDQLTLHLALLAAANHSADTEAQARWTGALARLTDTCPTGEDLARALGTLAVSAIDALDLPAARRALGQADASGVYREHRVHLDGPSAMLATLEGDFEQALAHRRRNVDQAAPNERARCLGDIADALLRLDRAEEALGVLDEALKPRRSGLAYHQRTLPYLHLHRARVLAALGRPCEEDLAKAEAAPGVDPAVRARLLRAERAGDRASILAEPDGGILTALRQRSLATLGDEAARAWLLARLGGDTWQEAGRRLPY